MKKNTYKMILCEDGLWRSQWCYEKWLEIKDNPDYIAEKKRLEIDRQCERRRRQSR